MTAREAIEKIKHIQDGLVNYTFLNPTREACLPLADALMMAIAALQASIPHVLTQDDVQAMEPHAPIWAEFSPSGIMTGPYEKNCPTAPTDRWWKEEYGKSVRWWTAWPDEELRAATPWEAKE